MKLRAKLGRESKLIELGERTSSSVTLGELSLQVSSQFNLQDHAFQLSLNKSDPLEGDDQPLSEFGLVSGDLVHIIGSDLPVREETAASSRERRQQPLAPYSSISSSTVFSNSNETATSTSDRTALGSGPSQSQSNMDVQGPDQVIVDGNTEAMANVNRFFREPLVVRESSATQVPILLHQLYTSVSCASNSDALWVVVHALMMEAGFVPCDCQVTAVMPESWKKPGFYLCNYSYNVSPEVTGSCSLTGVTLGSSVAVHAMPRTETGFKTETVHLNSSHYVRGLSDDVPSVYRALDKLSRQIKDVICMPVINELVTAAGYREMQGLLALPWEVTLRILTLLDAQSLCFLGQTCQEMKATCQDALVWRHLYIRDFGALDDNSLGRPWSQLYREKFLLVKEQKRQREQFVFVDPLWPRGPGFGPPGPFHPGPFPFPPNILGGDYDLNPEFAAGIPHPMGAGRRDPLRLPNRGNPRGLDPFSANPLQPGGRRGNMTGSPFANPFRGPFI